jgi:hypothetical protein
LLVIVDTRGVFATPALELRCAPGEQVDVFARVAGLTPLQSTPVEGRARLAPWLCRSWPWLLAARQVLDEMPVRASLVVRLPHRSAKGSHNSQPGCQFDGKQEHHLSRAHLVRDHRQGVLHRLDQVIPSLGWSGRPSWSRTGLGCKHAQADRTCMERGTRVVNKSARTLLKNFSHLFKLLERKRKT